MIEILTLNHFHLEKQKKKKKADKGGNAFSDITVI